MKLRDHLKRAIFVVMSMLVLVAPLAQPTSASIIRPTNSYAWAGHVSTIPAPPAATEECGFIANSASSGRASLNTHTYGSVDSGYPCGLFRDTVPAYQVVVRQQIFVLGCRGTCWNLINDGPDVWKTYPSHDVSTGYNFAGVPAGTYKLRSIVWVYGYGGAHDTAPMYVT
jgi:hypothetical protein